MLEEQKAEEEALELAEQHAAKNLEYLEEYNKAQEDIEKLSRETYQIIGETYDAGSKLKEIFAQDCDYLRKQLEDPLLDNDSTVRDGILELQAMRETMETMFKRMAEVSSKIAGAQKEAAELAAARAKETAKDASEAAATAVKTNAAPGAATAAPVDPKPDAKKTMSRAAARHRASRLAQGLGAWEVPLAWDMPLHERTPEDAAAAAKACKIARAERAEDEQMEADLSNS